MEQLAGHLDAIVQLSDKCFSHYESVVDKLIGQHQRRPSHQETIEELDEGHRAWFAMREKINSNPDWDVNRRFQERDRWYREWKSWFEEYHIEYFSDG